MELGLYIGVNGIATFAKNPDLSEVYRQIPIDNLVLETDSPFLTPSPLRGNINEPKNVRLVAEYLSSLRGENLEDLAAKTTNNARQLFSV
jgi:TatD DNase family protein